MIVNSSTNFRIIKPKYKEEHLSPKSETLLTTQKIHPQFNNQDIKRPLKTNHSDLSFKGLSLGYKYIGKNYSKQEFLEFAEKYIGKMGKELFEDVVEKHSNLTKNLISIDPKNPDSIIINKKTIPHLAWDNAVDIVRVFPGDILNGIVQLLGKVPGLKNWSAKTLERPMFKNIRQRSKIEAKVNALTGMITYRDVKIESAKESFAKTIGKKSTELTQEEIAKIIKDVDEKMESSVFQTELKQFDPKSGNYDTKHERALNRLVSGLPPAIFLATDAYNLSRMMDDDPKAADKEKKTRFKQETSRILTSGLLTLVTMGAFQKFINKSKAGIVLTTGITVLVTEMFSRLSNGKHITRLTPEQARKENERLNAPEAKIKPMTFKADETKPVEKSKEHQKPLLSFNTLMKGSAIVIGTGYGIKGIKHLPAVQKAALKYFENIKTNNIEKFEKLGIKELKQENAVDNYISKVIYKPFKNLYNKLTSQKYEIPEDDFNNVIKVLRENGFDKLAEKYDKVGKSALKTADGKKIIDLGTKDKTVKIFNKDLNVKPFVNFVIAPFKFMWNTVTLPYWMIDEKLMGVFRKSKPKSAPKDIQALANSFQKICREATRKNFNAEQFKDYVQVNLLKGFNSDSLSSISNAELSNLAKTAASIATIWFLMTDNYNMVMLKSNGNDKEGANTKFKERFVQEGSRLFYQTLLIDLFNSTFRNSYNASLMGMSAITITNTTLGEILTRTSVGTPIKTHTRDELIEIETKQNNSTGFKKKYYNFMQRLTGKRSIKSYEVAQKNNTAKNENDEVLATPSAVPANNNFFSSKKGTLETMIKK